MQELHIREQIVLQMAWDSIVMALGEIGLQIVKRLWEEMHNKDYQLYFANGDFKKEKDVKASVCFWCTVLIFHKDRTDYPTEQIE